MILDPIHSTAAPTPWDHSTPPPAQKPVRPDLVRPDLAPPVITTHAPDTKLDKYGRSR